MKVACGLCEAPSLEITLLMPQTFSRALFGLPVICILIGKAVTTVFGFSNYVFRLIVDFNFFFEKPVENPSCRTHSSYRDMHRLSLRQVIDCS